MWVQSFRQTSFQKYKTRVKETEVMFTFATVAPEENATMTMVLKCQPIKSL